jgi:hypothetical protein
VIGVLYSDIKGGGGVIKAGSDEAFGAFICFVTLNQSILSNITFGLSGISPAFLKALLHSFIVKVLLENCWKKEKKSVFDTSFVLRNTLYYTSSLKLCLYN